MKNTTPKNAPDTTIAVHGMVVNLTIRPEGRGVMYGCQPVCLDLDGKPFNTPRPEPMSKEEAAAFQAEMQAAVQDAAEKASLAYLARVFGFTPEAP